MKKSPFLESIRTYMAVRKYSKRTIESYLYWIKYFIVFNHKQHPDKLGAREIEAFLTHLAVNRQVSPSTQSIALNALDFLKTKFLQQALATLENFKKSTRQSKLPVVLTKAEVTALLEQLSGKYYLMAALLYGSGLRRMELVRLRVKDVDFDYKQLRVLFAKGAKHRVVTLSEQLLEPLRRQVDQVRLYLEQDCLNSAFAGVWMPEALSRKYPNAQKSLGWQYLFPASRLSVDPEPDKVWRRHHDENTVNKCIKLAVNKARPTNELSFETVFRFAEARRQSGK